MRRVRQQLAIWVIVTIALLALAPFTALAQPPVIGGNVNVGVGGSNGGANANVGVNVGANGGTNVSVGTGATNPAASGNANVGVGNSNGSAVSGNANANVGGSTGTTANVDATVGSGSTANANVNTSTGSGGSTASGNVNANVGGGSTAGVNANGGVNNSPNGTSTAGATACVQIGGSCGTAAPSASNTAPLVNGTVCLVVNGMCTPTGTAGDGTNPPTGGVNICIAAPGTCDSSGNPPPSLASGTVCVVVDGVCSPTGPTGTNGNPPTGGANLCVTIPGSCDSGTPGTSGTGVSGGGSTPVGTVDTCIVVTDACTITTTPDDNNPNGGVIPGGPGNGNPVGGVTPGGPVITTPGGRGTPGGPGIGNPSGGTPGIPGGAIPGGGIQISIGGAADIFANPDLTLNASSSSSAQPALCSLPLSPFSRDTGLSGTIVDCATVHVNGQRAGGSGYGTTQDGPAAGASTGVLHDSGKVSADLTGTCAGCDSAFGSGSGYKSFIQLKDNATGDFINVGIAHDAAPNLSGQSATGLTLVVETGRKTANGYDVSQGYIPASTNRVPSGHATIMLVWTAQGVAVYVNGIVPPNENAARPISVGTYNVHMSQPVASFAGAAKNGGDRVDTTFNAISFG